MANIIVVEDMSKALTEHDPFLWKCNSCGKERLYTQEEIDTTHTPYPDPQNHDYDFYITCPFCSRGVMEPPTFVSLGGL